jgi:hypothetical protein
MREQTIAATAARGTVAGTIALALGFPQVPGEVVMEGISVAEAAGRLGVSAARVRARIAAGDLPARKVAGRWLLDPYEVARDEPRPGGRPLSPRMAWALIALAEGGEPLDVSAPERSRLRRRLRDEPTLRELADLARRRARTHRLRAHPGALPRALAWPGAVPTGASAPGTDLVEVALAELYLPADQVDALVNGLRPRPAGGDANLVVHTPAVDHWPFTSGAGPLTVALDLWEAGDARSRRSAQGLFTRVLERRRDHRQAHHHGAEASGVPPGLVRDPVRLCTLGGGSPWSGRA